MNYYFGGTAGASLEAGRPRGARGAGSASVAEAAADRGAVTAGRAGGRIRYSRCTDGPPLTLAHGEKLRESSVCRAVAPHSREDIAGESRRATNSVPRLFGARASRPRAARPPQ